MRGNFTYNRKLREKPNNFGNLITGKTKYLVFPFDFTSGFINETERGVVDDSFLINDFTDFKKVFTGLNNVLVQWHNAYDVVLANEDDAFLTKSHKVGDIWEVYANEESFKSVVTPTQAADDFLGLNDERGIQTYLTREITRDDRYRLFVIKAKQDDPNKFMYIIDGKNIFHNGTFHHAEITLGDVNDLLSTSGRALDQKIQRGAPGEGFAWPVIGLDKSVTLDENWEKDRPVTSIQFEISGSTGFGAPIIQGRPVETETVDGVTVPKFNEKIEAPRILLPLRLEDPVVSEGFTKLTAETDYYMGIMAPAFYEAFGDWKEAKTNDSTIDARTNYEGVVMSKGDYADIVASNPVSGLTTAHTISDSNWNIDINHTYNVSASPFVDGEELTLNGTYRINEILAHNYFGLYAYASLPIELVQNTPFRLRNIPLIGGLVDKFSLGISPTWNNLGIRYAYEGAPLLIPKKLIEYANVSTPSIGTNAGKVIVPMEYFGTVSQDNQAVQSGNTANATIIKAQYTHRFMKLINGEEYVFDTRELDQIHPSVDDNEKTISGTIPEKLFWDETCIPTNRGTVPGYVIDIIGCQAKAKTDMRISAFSNNIPEFTGTYQTQPKYSNDPVDWTTLMKMSNWNATDGDKTKYPETIVAPPPPNINNPIIEIIDINNNDSEIFIQARRNANLEGSRWEFENNALTERLVTKSFDTTPYGGITAFNNNYEEIRFNFQRLREDQNDRDYQDQQLIPYIVNIQELITAGEIEISFYDYQSFWVLDYRINPNNNLLASRTQINNIDQNCKYKLSINGDLIELTLSIAKGNTWDDNSNISVDGLYGGFEPEWQIQGANNDGGNRFREFITIRDQQAIPTEINQARLPYATQQKKFLGLFTKK